MSKTLSPTEDRLLGQWAVPNDDGTYDVIGRYGNRVAASISVREALRLANKLALDNAPWGFVEYRPGVDSGVLDRERS